MSNSFKRILKNLLIFAVLMTALVAIVLASLNKYTQHDSAITVPDVTSLTVDEAAPFFEKKDLRYKVVDSVRVVSQAPGAILEQKPAPGAHVKQNRIIFLTINASSEEKVAIPDVKDCSQRQAVATLEANGFRVRNVEFVPSEFRDLVLGVSYNGRNIAAGYKLPKGTPLTLVVGQSSTSEEVTVPSMHGLTLEEANVEAHSKSMNIGTPHYDVVPANSEAAKSYRVYKQDPITGTLTSIGKKIDLWMTTNAQLLEAPEEIYVPEDSLSLEEE
jgi:beta-lactam-binding protein with PASTA domain